MGIFQRLAELESAGKSAALVTIVADQGSVPRHAGSKMLVLPDGSAEGTIGGGEMERQVVNEALEAIRDGSLRIKSYSFRDPGQGDVGVCGGEIKVLIEPIKPQPTLLIIGAGHVGSAVAHLGRWLGFRIVMSDDRPEFITPEAAPDADERLHVPIAEVTGKVSINSQTYVLLTTRGVDIDVDGLPALLEGPAPYIGVIGSRRRWETTAHKLLEAGVSKRSIDRVTSPMGLELNAETPEEIAISILAEIIMLRRGGSGDPMDHHVADRRPKGAEPT